METIANCLESCANIVQAVVCRTPCCCLDEISRLTLFAQEDRPNPRSLTHEAVAAAVSHKHHSIIHVGAGLIQFVYCSHSKLRYWLTITRFYFRHFSRVFFDNSILNFYRLNFVIRGRPTLAYFESARKSYQGLQTCSKTTRQTYMCTCHFCYRHSRASPKARRQRGYRMIQSTDVGC